MNIKDKFVKIVLVGLLGSVAINLSSLGMNEAVIHPEIEKNNWSCFPSQTYSPPSVLGGFLANNQFNQTNSSLLGYLFQIMFILFFISPPLIVVMLFLIWKELKERNKMQ